MLFSLFCRIAAAAAAIGCAMPLHAQPAPGCEDCDAAQYVRPAGCPSCPRVNADYTPNPSGAYRAVRNIDSSGAYGFSVIPSDGSPRKRIPMADPAIFAWNGWYYVTGLSPAAKQANFCIYKSQNLIDWHPHMMAFDESRRCGVTNPLASYTRALEGPPGQNFCTLSTTGGSVIRIQPDRWFSSLLDPQFFQTNGDTIWLSFSAQEYLSTAGMSGFDCSNIDQMASACSGGVSGIYSVYLVSMPLAQFITGGPNNFFASAQAPGTGGQPFRYAYRKNNNPSEPLIADGGYAQGHTIPTTGSLDQFDCASLNSAGTPGLLKRYPTSIGTGGYRSYRFVGTTRESMLAMGPFTFTDPLDSNRTWLLYTWLDAVGNSTTKGNNISAYPLLFPRTLDAAAGAGGLIRLGHRSNDYNQPPNCAGGSVLNGMQAGGIDGGGVCEGPAAFTWPKTGSTRFNYVIYSRNGYAQPAYGMFYRHVMNQPLSALALPADPALAQAVPERPLITSIDRRPRSCGGYRVFGHGELFEGPGGKPYAIFHAGDDEWLNTSCFFRTVFFKELTISPQDGTILPVSNNGSGDASDTDVFLVPW